jgi:hypothetical protein
VTPDDPCPRFKLEVKRLNAGAKMARVKVVLAVTLPDVAVTVTVSVPVGAEPPAFNVKLLKLVVGLGENDAVTPAGRPDTEKFTVPVNP